MINYLQITKAHYIISICGDEARTNFFFSLILLLGTEKQEDKHQVKNSNTLGYTMEIINPFRISNRPSIQNPNKCDSLFLSHSAQRKTPFIQCNK